MKKGRVTLLIVFIFIAAFLAAACSAQPANENSQPESSDESSPAQSASESSPAQSAGSGETSNDENTIYGNVTAIEGSSITLALGTLNQDSVPGGNEQRGAQPSGDGQNGGGQAPSGMPSGQPSDMPSGQPSGMPSGGEQPSMLTLTGETITIAISDESLITTPGFNANTSRQDSQQSSEPTDQKTGLAAIQTGSVLQVVYASDNETIQSITVMNGFRGGQNGGNTNPSPSGEASAE